MAGELDTKEEIKDQSIHEIRVMKDFSAKTPSEIVEKLKTILLNYDVVPLLDADESKLTYTTKSELDSDSKKKGIEPEFCEVWVEILKISDFLKEVKFTKIAGSTYHFDE
jgi:hypothetical protein